MAQTKEQKAAYNRAWYAANKERVRTRNKAYWKANQGKALAALRRRRGVVDATEETRKGACPICLRTRALHCDHDHATGQIRGWLCFSCNTKLGWLQKPGREDMIRAYLDPNKLRSCAIGEVN